MRPDSVCVPVSVPLTRLLPACFIATCAWRTEYWIPAMPVADKPARAFARDLRALEPDGGLRTRAIALDKTLLFREQDKLG